LPLLGHVPAIPDREPTVVTNLPARSHVAEAYRTLRSSIGFAAVEGSLRTMMVTSASKGEGKTVTSLNLAIAMALDGKRVILVDSDLRRPSIHKRLNLPQGPGLTDVLVGQAEVEEVLNATEVAGLRVMTAGPIPPNPAELLNSAPMDRLIEQLRDLADVVIFDSAPCIPVSDSIVLSPKVDGVVLVVHAGETKKAAVKHTREMLDRARARTLGIVFNRVPQRRGGYYYYYYYYYGGYYEEGAEDRGRRGRRERRRAASQGPEAVTGAEQTKE
jgi:capsular exopolysaccharide synthesis family protein